MPIPCARYLLLLLLLQPLRCASAAETLSDVATPELAGVAPLDPDSRLWARVLAQVVRAGGVDYAQLRAHPQDLDAYRVQLAQAPLPGLPSQRAERLALLINAYNACTLALVRDALPENPQQWPAWSIRSLSGPTDAASVWKHYTFALCGSRYTLDQIEATLLRPLGEPRIHLTLNCASRSCPALLAAPLVATTLEAQFAEAAHRFVTDPRQVHLERRMGADTLVVTPLLDWYAADFAPVGGVRAFLAAQHPDAAVAAWLAQTTSPEPPLRYSAYDWRLNLAPAAADAGDAGTAR